MTNKGLFIDLDGTLANSLPALRDVYYAFLAGLGAEGSETEFQQLNGPPLIKIIEMLQEHHDLPGAPADLLGRYSTMIHKAHELAPPAEGAQVLLEHARRQGWRVAVVTSSPRLSALEWLKSSGLLTQVDAVVGGDEVAFGKPAPDSYNLALSRLNSAAAHSLAVEDSRIGAISALAAGLPTLVLASLSDQPDYPPEVGFIDTLADLMEML